MSAVRAAPERGGFRTSARFGGDSGGYFNVRTFKHLNTRSCVPILYHNPRICQGVLRKFPAVLNVFIIYMQNECYPRDILRILSNREKNVKKLPFSVYAGIFMPSKTHIIRQFPTSGKLFDISLYKMHTKPAQKHKVLCIVGKIAKRA